jgi:hypothetical protein
MEINKVGLVISLALWVTLQGCGGGGSSSVKSEIVDELSLASTTESLKKESKPIGSLSTLSIDKTIFILKERVDIFPDYNATTTYSYVGDFIASSKRVTTDGMVTEKQYKYDAANNILDVKVKNLLGEMELSQRAIFEDGESNTLINLARNDMQVYLFNTFDTITYHDNVRIKEDMSDIEMELFNVRRYSYTANQLTTLTQGYRDTLLGTFVEEASHHYTYGEVPSVDGVAINLNHTFTYSDDNKTVTEMAEGVMLHQYIFEVQE